MPEPARIISIPCPFGLTGGTVYVYYIDAPEPAIVDVGVAGSPEGVIEPALAAQGIKLSDVKWILASHGHWDHIGGAGTGKERAPDARIALHPADAEWLADPRAHIRGYAGVRFRFIDDPAAFAAHDAMLLENLSGEMAADRPIEDGDRIDLGGGVTITTVHTPGHSAGAVTFILDGADWAFTGDSVQGCGARGAFPLIEHPNRYRASLKKLREDVRPKRLMMGHNFGGWDGVARSNILDDDAAATMLRESAERAEQLAAIAPTLKVPADRPYDPSQFASAAKLIGADLSDPVSWPGSIFLTMDAFRRASQA